MRKKRTNKQYIKQAQQVHGNRFDYSKLEYKNAHGKVIIICDVHGEFKQAANDHLKGSGCSKCGGVCKKTTHDFICGAKKKHGNKYDYSKVEYKGDHINVDIICPKHGVFEQIPKVHLRSKVGCPKCAIVYQSNQSRVTIKDFIERSKEINSDKYLYSSTKSKINSRGKSVFSIICRKHGEFWQEVSNHLSSEQGCPRCSNSKGERLTESVIKQLNYRYIPQYTIYHKGRKCPLRIDFYIPISLIAIEYHGIQHYEPVPCWGGAEKFAHNQGNDQSKRDYCAKHNIRLIEIPYWEKDNIAQILLKEIGYNPDKQKEIKLSGEIIPIGEQLKLAL